MYAQHTASLYDGRQGRNTYPSAPFSAVQGTPARGDTEPRCSARTSSPRGPGLPPLRRLRPPDHLRRATPASSTTCSSSTAPSSARRRPRLAGRPLAGRLRRGASSLSLGAPPGLWPGAPHHRGRQPDRGHRGGQHLQGRAVGRRPRRLGVGRPLPGQHQHPPLRGALPPGGGQRVPLRRRAPRRRGWQRLPPRAVHERRLPGGVLHQRRRAPRPDLQLDLLGQRLPLQPPPGDAQHRDPRRVQRGEPLPAQRRPRGADGGGGGGTTVHAHDGPYNILRENYARILRVLKARDRDNRLLANWHVEPTVNQGTGTAQEGNQRVPAGWSDFPYAPFCGHDHSQTAESARPT